MLTKCYCVVYHVADFAADNEIIYHQDAYRDYNNALLVAKDLAKYFDVVDDVYVIDGLTGEVLNTILKDAPQEDTTEEDNVPAFTEEFDDGTGGMWRRANDGKWEYDCTGFGCSDCAYCGVDQLCVARRSATTKDRDAQIESAKERMCAKANETEKEHSTPVDTYKDKNGDTWYSGGNGKWKFDCTNRHCSDCPYYDEEYGCIVEEPLHEVDRNYQVALAHEKMRAKAKETKGDSTSASNAKEEENSSSSGIFDDGIGGVWKLAKNNTWSYNCKGLDCLDCAYYDEGHCFASGHVTKEKRDILIKSAKAKMKK